MAATDLPASTEGEKCPLCEAPLSPGADHCIRCDWVRGYRNRVDAGNIEGRDVAAAFLSIIPGAGHLYKGHTLLGWLFLGGALLVCFAAVVFFMFFGPLLIPLYWFFVMFLAYWADDLKIGTPPAGRDFPA